MKINMEIQSKSIEQYEVLLKEFKRVQLKKIAVLIDFLRDKLDLFGRGQDAITVSEDEIETFGLSLEEVKNIYSRFCTKQFEVFRTPNKADPAYPVSYLPNPMTSESTPDNKITMCLDIQLFPKNDPRNNNFRNFTIALQNSISGINEPEIKKLGVDLHHGKIEKLTIVKPKVGSRFKIVINDNYQGQLIWVDRAKPSWDLLFQVVEESLVDAGGRKSSIDFLNSNKRCRLYTKTGYQITKILKVEGGYIVPAIEVRIITEKAFQQRVNKSRKVA